jgi:hypothetical protein
MRIRREPAGSQYQTPANGSQLRMRIGNPIFQLSLTLITAPLSVGTDRTLTVCKMSNISAAGFRRLNPRFWGAFNGETNLRNVGPDP